MLARTAVLIVVTVFVLFFVALTIHAVIDRGFTPATVIAVVVLALFAFGGIGALRQPPSE